MPPKAKVFEALSAVGDGRVKIIADGDAEVLSSERDKSYRVRWQDSRFSSSDPASRFHGYIGYPVIAVLLQTGLIAHNPKASSLLAEVPWNKLNKKFKRDYDAAVQFAMADLSAEDRELLIREAMEIYEALAALDLSR